MKKFFIFCILLTIGFFQTHAFAQKNDEEKNEKEILSVQLAMRRLVSSKNYDSLKYFMSDNVYMQKRDGIITSLTDLIESYKSKKYLPVVKTVQVGTPYIFIHDHIGVVVGKILSTRVQADGSEITYPINYTGIYTNQENRWKLLSLIHQDAAN
ncbi:MAG: nuclear transport factor 2 family protein [Phycisphaerales bacterium]|nr:nuclear transport factor 2 family protein [Phycisphaerales bacterium]